MTRKDFVALAKVLRANRADTKLVAEIAEMLADTNDRFDRKRFIAAATATEGK